MSTTQINISAKELLQNGWVKDKWDDNYYFNRLDNEGRSEGFTLSLGTTTSEFSVTLEAMLYFHKELKPTALGSTEFTEDWDVTDWDTGKLIEFVNNYTCPEPVEEEYVFTVTFKESQINTKLLNKIRANTAVTIQLKHCTNINLENITTNKSS